MAEKGNILSTDPGFTYFEKAPDIDPGEFQKVIDSRRAVRIFDDTKIPEEVMLTCLRNGLLAPNSSNLQPWELYWVKSEEKREKLIAACFNQVAAKHAAELVVVAARYGTSKPHARGMFDFFTKLGSGVPRAVLDYYGRLAPAAYEQGPFGVFGFIKRVIYFFRGIGRPTLREPVTKSHLKIWAVKKTALGAR